MCNITDRQQLRLVFQNMDQEQLKNPVGREEVSST